MGNNLQDVLKTGLQDEELEIMESIKFLRVQYFKKSNRLKVILKSPKGT